MILNPITLITGIAFAPLAGACAYIITYGEYQHHYPDNKIPRKLALEAAIGTFVAFLLISVVIGLFLHGIVNQ